MSEILVWKEPKRCLHFNAENINGGYMRKGFRPLVASLRSIYNIKTSVEAQISEKATWNVFIIYI